jgi:hypothetical protein
VLSSLAEQHLGQELTCGEGGASHKAVELDCLQSWATSSQGSHFRHHDSPPVKHVTSNDLAFMKEPLKSC